MHHHSENKQHQVCCNQADKIQNTSLIHRTGIRTSTDLCYQIIHDQSMKPVLLLLNVNKTCYYFPTTWRPCMWRCRALSPIFAAFTASTVSSCFFFVFVFVFKGQGNKKREHHLWSGIMIQLRERSWSRVFDWSEMVSLPVPLVAPDRAPARGFPDNNRLKRKQR